MDWVKIGMVNLRDACEGGARGAAFAGEGQGCLDARSTLEDAIGEEAEDLGLAVTREWLAAQSCQILELYEEALGRADGEGVAREGFVFDVTLPSGRKLLMGSPSVLDKLNRLQ